MAITDKQVEAAALALLNTGCVREPVAATESFMLARARSMARAALEAAEAAAWETIESAPKDGTIQIVLSKGKVIGGMWLSKHKCWTDEDGFTIEPTMWFPLPQPPKETT